MTTFAVETLVMLIILWLIYKYVWPLLNAMMDQAPGGDRQGAGRRRGRPHRRRLRRGGAAPRPRGGQGPGGRDRRPGQAATPSRSPPSRWAVPRPSTTASWPTPRPRSSWQRQRAVEDAATLLGDVVMAVVEQVIGREVDADVHQDLIDQAVAAIDATAAAEAAGTAAMNPSLQGYAAAILGELDASARARPSPTSSPPSTSRCRPTTSCALALTDTSVPGLQRASRARRAPRGQGLRARPAPGRLRLRSSARPRTCPPSTGLPRRPCPPGRLGRLRARGEPLGALRPQARRRLRHGALRGARGQRTSRRSRTSSSASPASSSPTPTLRRRARRPRPARRGRARRIVDALVEGQGQRAAVALLGYAVAGGRARDIVGTVDWLVDQTAQARGWRVARVRAGQAARRVAG